MYLIIELHGGAEYAYIITDTDGSNMVFETEEAAQLEANNCHKPFIINVNNGEI